MDSETALEIARINRIPSVPLILEVITQMTGMRFAAVARVTDTQWIALAVRDLIEFGLFPGDELELKSTICDEIRQHHQPVIFDQASVHPVFATHHTPKRYGLESYISVPILRKDGRFFGTLCAIDPAPANIESGGTLKMFMLFAQLIAEQLDSAEGLHLATTELATANEAAEVREQFIAVLGHDLRNPLSGIAGVAEFLLRENNLSEKGRRYVRLMQGSVARMAKLIEDVLDLARGRLGGGIPMHRDSVELEPVLRQVVAELKASAPDREIVSDIAILGIVECDPIRIGQLLSNLLANAMAHGKADSPVRVSASVAGASFKLEVTNSGNPIPPEAIGRLFQPYFREPHSVRQGLGLGLFIVSEIAKGHGGRIKVRSTEAETTFEFVMPIR